MGTIAKVTAGGATHLIASTAYATCSTGASTAAKVATIQDSQAFTLIDGITVHVYFTYSNTASSPTLNVNSTGAKAIYKYGNTAAGTTEVDSWPAGSVVSFTYNKNGASSGCWTINNFQTQTAQVNSNWTATTGVASILNKPTIPSTYSDVGAASAAHTHGADEIIWTGDQSLGTELEGVITNVYSQTKRLILTVGSSTITFATVLAAIQAGKEVVAKWSPQASDKEINLNLIDYADYVISFSGFSTADDDCHYGYYAWYYSDNTWETGQKEIYFTVSPTLSSGTKIAEIYANGATASLYAPTPSGGGSYTATAPISLDGTDIQHVDSGVTSGTYSPTRITSTGAYYIPTLTVNNTGHLTSISSTGFTLPIAQPAVSGLLPSTQHFVFDTSETYFTIAANTTVATYTFSNPNTNLLDSYQISGVTAVDATTWEPVIIDWKPNQWTAPTSITFSLANNYSNQIRVKVLVSRYFGH